VALLEAAEEEAAEKEEEEKENFAPVAGELGCLRL
jgi:hypothetical protein